MPIRSAEAAATRAESSMTNRPGMCQQWTRDLFGAPSVGDVDHDGDADAVDGWKKEPAAHRHKGTNPPRGAPMAWSGGRHGFGHRAISLGRGLIRSIDAGGPGRVATVPTGWIERNWGLNYLGWSTTISGILIPGLPHISTKVEQDIEVEPPEPSRKSITDIAREVINGHWGNGAERQKNLKAAGYNYKDVQARVNELLGR